MKKFIKICCLIVIVLFLLQLPVFGYVPFGEAISAYKLTKYADATGLTRENIGKVKTVFNSYFSGGSYKSTNYIGLSYNILSNRINDEISDKEFAEKAREDFVCAVETLPYELDFSQGISGDGMIHATESTDGSDFKKKYNSIDMYSIINCSDVTFSDEESMKILCDIVWGILQGMGDEYNFCRVQAIYTDRNGTFEIYVNKSFSGKEIRYKDLEKEVEKKY